MFCYWWRWTYRSWRLQKLIKKGHEVYLYDLGENFKE